MYMCTKVFASYQPNSRVSEVGGGRDAAYTSESCFTMIPNVLLCIRKRGKCRDLFHLNVQNQAASFWECLDPPSPVLRFRGW